MPTYETTPRFVQELRSLTHQQRHAFDRMIPRFVNDLRRGSFRKGLRVKRVQGHPGLFELTYAPDGRALFRYGAPHRAGDPHIIWERIGTHGVFEQP